MPNHINEESIKKVPTDMLIAELKRRFHEFMSLCTQVLAVPPEAPAPEAEVTSKGLGTAEVETPPKEAVAEAAARLADSMPKFSRAAEAGLAVPQRKTDQDLAPGHFVPRGDFRTDVMKDPVKRAAMNEALARNYSTPDARDIQSELRASGHEDLADEMTRMPAARAASMMPAPSLQQIVAANKRNAADAFVQPILPPSLAGAVRAPTITERGWFDDPAVVTLSLRALMVNPTPPRPGIPVTSEAELDHRAGEFAKAVTGAIAMLKTDGFTGHLPAPVVRLRGEVLTLLLEPVVIWRLLLHLGPRVPYVHVAENLRVALNAHITANVAEAEQVLLVGNADSMPNAFRDAVTSRVMSWYHDAQDGGQPKIAQALKRQVRILNPEFAEKEIPDERTADRMKLSDPRALWGEDEVPMGPGTQIGRPSNKTARLHFKENSEEA